MNGTITEIIGSVVDVHFGVSEIVGSREALAA